MCHSAQDNSHKENPCSAEPRVLVDLLTILLVALCAHLCLEVPVYWASPFFLLRRFECLTLPF